MVACGFAGYLLVLLQLLLPIALLLYPRPQLVGGSGYGYPACEKRGVVVDGSAFFPAHSPVHLEVEGVHCLAKCLHEFWRVLDRPGRIDL